MKVRATSSPGDDRRSAILARLRAADNGTPVSAAALADAHGVSRQIIVGDIALLRSAGHPIDATPRGYVLRRTETGGGHLMTLICRHTAEQMVDELNTLVDCGCTVLDVAVEHPVYGTLTGELRLSSRWDVQVFAEKVAAADALPLSALTEGVHVHAVLAPTEAQAEAARRAMEEKGYLWK